MTRAASALLLATALAALAFGGGPDLLPAIAVTGAAAALTWGAATGRPARWGLRIAYVLLFAYLATWTWTAVGTWRLARGVDEGAAVERLEAAARRDVARALSDRLGEDRSLAERTARRLAADGTPAAEVAEAAWFVALRRAAPERFPEGVGVELYDPQGALRAWWGDPRGERLPPDSIDVALEGGIVRRPTGWVIAYTGTRWTDGTDSLRVVVKDLWAVESPLRREALEPDLVLASLARETHLAFRVVPDGEAREGAAVVGPTGEPVATIDIEGFLLDRYVAERRRTGERAMALLLLWPLVLAIGIAWEAARAVPRRLPGLRAGRRWANVSAVGARMGLIGLGWAFLVQTRLPARILPESWFSPLGFAAPGLGPAGRSAGHFVLTAAAVAVLAWTAWALLARGRDRSRRPVVAVVAVGLALALSAGLARLAIPLMEGALEGMSPAAFFSPTLLFAPPLLLVLLGFALLAATVVVALAGALRASGTPDGLVWGGGAAAAFIAAVTVAAWRLPEASMAGHRLEIAMPAAIALVAGAWITMVVGRPKGPRGRSPVVRVAVIATAAGALATLPLAAYARVQAAHELLVERAQRIGQASTQWLDYTMTRTVEHLAAEPAVAEAIRTGNRDAALSLWSGSPLRELDFATGLFLFDTEGSVVSHFSLAPGDLTERARRFAEGVDPAQVAVRGSQGTGAVRWAVVPVRSEAGERIGTAVAMTTGSVELREQGLGGGFVLTDLLAGGGVEPDAPGYTTLGPEQEPPPRTLLTRVRALDEIREAGTVQLAMPLDPLLPGPRGTAVFVLAACAMALMLVSLERAGDPRARARGRARLAAENPLRSFRAQLVLAFLAVAAIPLTLYAALGYRTTRLELEEATRSAASEALDAASRLLERDRSLAIASDRELSARLREIGDVLQQDLVLYWRGHTRASSRPEIFASRLFADRMEGSVYAALFVERHPIAFDATTLGDRSFLVAYRALTEPDAPPGYALATPLLIREDRVRVDLQRLGEGVFLLSAFSIGFLLVVGWGLARFMSRPLSALEEGTRHIAAGRLTYRLPTPARRDEFGRVQRAFNAMAGRLDESQRALEREKSRVQAILASVGAGVVALDEKGRVRLLNDRAADLLGVDADAVVGERVEVLARRDEPTARFWGVVTDAFAREARADRDLVLTREGEERHYHVVCTGLVDGAGEERGLVVAFEDITANVQSQRVLAWGEMARQVAHEIKNPLTPMKLSLQHLERTVEDRSPDFERLFHRNVELVLSEIDRLEKIAGSFARFGVPEPAVVEPFDAVAVAEDALALFRTGDDGVDYAIEVIGEPTLLLGEGEGFRRVLVNLLQNAREAVLSTPDRRGRVAIEIDFATDPDPARVSVVDDGIGLPESAAGRLFEPSFSTKTRGTGLGLAIVKRMVEAWGGSVEWERRSPRGTAIHLDLRRAEPGRSRPER